MQGQLVDEYQLKAAYMYNFAKFVDWPADALGDRTRPFAICVLGQTPLSQALRDALSGKVWDQRPLEFRQISDSSQAGKCQILFISLADKQTRLVLAEVKPLPVLTVGESEDFINQGGVVRFLLDGARVRLEFNLDAADSARLRVSAKLLGLAKAVRRADK